jgi:hypothetical protein
MRMLAALVALAAVACTTSATHVTIDRTDCITCHTAEYASTNTGAVSICRAPSAPRAHEVNHYATTCADCHGTFAWCPAVDPLPDRSHNKFDITSTSHGGWDCADCHTAITYGPPDPKITDRTATGIDCTGCHWHDQARTDMNHLGNGNYVYAPASCIRDGCHGQGGRQ